MIAGIVYQMNYATMTLGIIAFVLNDLRPATVAFYFESCRCFHYIPYLDKVVVVSKPWRHALAIVVSKFPLRDQRMIAEDVPIGSSMIMCHASSEHLSRPYGQMQQAGRTWLR